jgi:hypothetical protein
MKKAIRSGGGSAVLLGIAITSWGCTDETTGFFIQGNVLTEAPACVARAESSSTLLLTGLLDVALRSDYTANLLVGSQLAPRGDKTNLRTETMITNITGAEVHLFTDTGANVLEFTVPAVGTILPEASSDPGLGIVTATLVPASMRTDLVNELLDSGQPLITRVAEVSVFGKTIGGLEIESSPFTYLIRVCYGCLVEFPAEAQGAVNTFECTSALDEAPVTPCRPGQDEGVDCRLCQSANEACLFPNGVP